jgi:hypothetical protein
MRGLSSSGIPTGKFCFYLSLYDLVKFEGVKRAENILTARLPRQRKQTWLTLLRGHPKAHALTSKI